MCRHCIVAAKKKKKLKNTFLFNLRLSGNDATSVLCNHRQPKRNMCGFGLQRSFGRNILELLVYYLMLNKCKNLKDMKSSGLSVCTSSLYDNEGRYSCIITCDSGP